MPKYCPECGADLKEGYSFCGKCGSKITIREPIKQEPKPKVDEKITKEKTEQKEKKEAVEKPKETTKKKDEEIKEKKTKEEKKPSMEKIIPEKTGKIIPPKSNKRMWGILAVFIIAAVLVGAFVINWPDPVIPGSAPSADFMNDISGSTASFTSTSTDADGIIVQCSWNFGDEATSYTQNPTHQYDYAGTYTVTLTVTDNDGNKDSITKTVTITTTQPTPDSDGDGYNDDVDAFPYDPSEWKDSDNDNVGDNSDKFDYDSTQWADRDGDGYGDNPVGNNPDDFPDNPSEWRDSDNDEYGDNSDAFPNDSTEWFDSDKDGIGDNSDIYPYDKDNDGYDDDIDYYDDGNAEIKISILKYNVLDPVDEFAWNPEAEIYFEVRVNGVLKARFPSSGYEWSAIHYLHAISNWYVIVDLADDMQEHEINIRMYDDDTTYGIGEQQLLDIDGHDNSEALTLYYDIATGGLTSDSDDMDGTTDGRDDGISEKIDCYLEYAITMT